MKSLSITKRLAVAAVAAAALAGPVSAAHAFTVTQGDAILAVYGNGLEYSKDIGSIASVLAGVDVDLNPFLAQIGPVANLKYTLVGFTGTTALFGDGSAIGSFTNGQKNLTQTGTIISGLQGWGGANIITPNLTDPIFTAAASNSFSTNMDVGGTGTLGSAVPLAAFSNVDSILNLLEKTGTSGATMVQVGTGLFSSATGHFVIGAAPVPVPAAVVLFATGIVGLIGVARRKMFGQQ